MRILRIAIILAVAYAALGALLHPGAAHATRRIPSYRGSSDLLATTPSTDDGTIGALANPAQWGFLEKPELSFLWSDENVRDGLDNWGFAMGKGIGFALRRRDFRVVTDVDEPPSEPRHVTDYQIGFAGGTGAGGGGLAFGWSGGDEQLADRASFVSLGTIHRPSRYLSFGAVGRLAFGGADRDAVLDIGIRPFADPTVLVFADYALAKRDGWDEGSLAGGLEIRPTDGLSAALKWDDEERFQLALGVTIQRTGFRAVPHNDDNVDDAVTTFGPGGDNEDLTSYAVRLNPPIRGLDLDRHTAKEKRLLEMNLKGRLGYQHYRFGDEGTLALREVTEQVRFAIEDPTVAGIAINLSGLEANATMIWELREMLLRLRAAGKMIAIYCDRLDLPHVYLASVADHVILDPQGDAILPGVQLSRTYQKEMLAKIGVGFDEWRYFKYKSAMETYSRTSMSEEDREQRQGLVNETYEELVSGIAASGRISRDSLDQVINTEPILLPRRMLELGLVDRLGHWEDVDAAIDTLAGRKVSLVKRKPLEVRRWQPDEEWGARPVIALVYAVGECAMDTGIKGRATSKALRDFRKSDRVKAVVVRADSPGGDPLPSDLVAHEMEGLSKAGKPIFVSQGRVAASGGYWISMDADSIFASPFTITGSIGIIGGWFWNEGFGAKLGLTSDRVQMGRSADLLGGLRLPILGATLPERNLDERERGLVTSAFRELYDGFTQRVAAGRGLEIGYVREIAEGRVYLGRPALELRLVDRIGTLDDAIEAAKRAAGIAPERRVRIVEYPKRGFFRWPSLLRFPSPPRGAAALGLHANADHTTYEETVLRGILTTPGKPLLLAPSGLLPDEEAVAR